MFYLQIGTDPTTWVVSQAHTIGEVAQELTQAIAVPVEFPLVGTLVVSPRGAGAVWVSSPPPMGSHPSGAKLPGPVIRAPSAAEATPEAPGGYPLVPGTNLAQLQQDIIAAMNGGTLLTVPVVSKGEGAVLVLSGATLAYAVVSPAS